MDCNKFKVGDLVTLSAAGSKIQQNWGLVGGFGIIVDLSGPSVGWPVWTKWFGGDYSVPKSQFPKDAYFKPYELKFFKKKVSKS